MATVGVGFAILVVFIQLGFYGAVFNTALAVSERFDAELMLISPSFVYLGETGTIPRSRLYQALAHPDVASATPIYFRYANWRDPGSGNSCRLFAIGFPLAEAEVALPLRLPALTDQLEALKAMDTLLLDRSTHEKCGPVDPEGRTEIRDVAARVVGHFDLGVGFLADGAMVVSDDSFAHFFRGHPLDRPHLGLLKLHPDGDPEAAAKALGEILPPDVRVVTRSELSAYQTLHWVDNTAVGDIFGMGAVAGFFVGVVVLFQILSADIRNQLPLYATLRAMGYSQLRLKRYILEQAWIYALLGYGPALLVGLATFPVIEGLTHLPIFLSPGLAAGVLIASLLMCSLSALLSARRLQRADPAELF